MPKSSTELRSFLYGIMTGIFILIGSLVVICAITGVRFQLVAHTSRDS